MPGAVGFRAGYEIMVKYDGDPTQWHIRILIIETTPEMHLKIMGWAALGENIWWVLTPDKDCYPESLAVPPLLGIGFRDIKSKLIQGSIVGRNSYLNQVYDFDRLPCPAAFRELEIAVRKQMTTGGEGRDTGGADGSGGAGLAPDHGQVSLEDEEGGGENDEEEAEVDARVLAICREPGGRRWRAFRDGVEALTETDWEAWPLTGPRTVLWCCKFIIDVDGTPRARHTRWVHESGLGPGDIGVADHETGLRALEFAVCFDQINVPELAALELIMRKVQLAELKNRERILGKHERIEYMDDEYLYLGQGQTRGQLMICPALEEYVSSEMVKEGNIMKERRKLREERNLARRPGPKNKGDGKGKDKKGGKAGAYGAAAAADEG